MLRSAGGFGEGAVRRAAHTITFHPCTLPVFFIGVPIWVSYSDGAGSGQATVLMDLVFDFFRSCV